MKRAVAELEASDNEVGKLRELCPCHVGWEPFEQNVSVVMRLLKHPNQLVRAHAMHILGDAAVMQTKEELHYYLEPGEEKIGEKRASGFRSISERLEARRESRIRKSKKSYRRSCQSEWQFK
jgi:hypothetical protein